MKRFIVALMLAVTLLFSGAAIALEMPEIEGSFKYLFRAKVLTLGASAMVADFSRDDSETPLSLSALPMKILYSSSLKGTAAWTVSGESERNGLLPDYGGLEASIDVMKLLRNVGAISTNPNVSLALDTGVLVDISKLLDSPSVLDLQPAIGASLKYKF